MKLRFTLLLCLAILVSCTQTQDRSDEAQLSDAAPAKKSTRQLMQKISFSFNHEPIGSAVRSLSVLTGIDISISPEVVSATEMEKRTVTLTVEHMPLAYALDWLVRQLDADYQETKSGDVWITKGYRAKDKITTASIFIPGLFADPEAADVIAILNAAIRPLGMKRDVVIAVKAKRHHLVVQAPSSVVARMREVVDALSVREERAAFVLPDNLEKLLDKKMLCRFNVTSVDRVVEKIRSEVGLNVGYRQAPLDARTVRQTISMDAGHITVRDLFDLLVAMAGFDRWELEPHRGVWLYAPEEQKYSTSAELPWRGTIVRSYPAGSLVKRMDPKKLEDAVRDVCGGPSELTLVKFSAATNRLLVIEEPHIIQRVEDYLQLARLLSKSK